ncbi:hypothetical protein [Microbacterium sp. CJ88]|uniref:hypothetical protein n=1 Tax=Microbacterium sp. CJ88 TaxID=3445672 RepID=UPI003F65EF81
MFIVYLVLFLGGMYLLGLAFTLTSLQALVFLVGLGAIMLALALIFRKNRA